MVARTDSYHRGGGGSWNVVKDFKVSANDIQTGSTFCSREINSYLKFLIFAQIIKT